MQTLIIYKSCEMSVLNYVSCVPSCPTCLTCLRFLRVHVPYVFTCPTCLRAFVPFFLRAFLFFYVTNVPSFFFVPCVPSLFYVPSFFTCLTRFQFFRVYILFMYMLIKLTQINENLSSFTNHFHFSKTPLIFCMSFSFFETENINYF